MAQARALLFDFDGTLAPNLDLPDLRRRVVSLTLAHGVPEAVFSGRYIVEILDAGAAWLAPRDSARGSELHAHGHRLIRDFEIEAARRTEPFADARGLLAGLRDCGMALAVVTRNCRAAVQAAFPDIADYCDAVLARDDVAHLKPDVRHVRQALEVLGHAPHQAVMVGDGQLDMHMGRALGLYCVGVLTGSSDAGSLREAGADAVLARAGDLAAALV
ncbi:MAG: HAD family hydrolase [Gammaproteobacteria bacterium]|nr:HAD family hydrolase [Gammaproteobacteria bacterium]